MFKIIQLNLLSISAHIITIYCTDNDLFTDNDDETVL